MMTVKQMSSLTGVSVRTLQFYDEIGLLKPTQVTEAGYRMYDENTLAVLQQILFFKELDFTLKEIKAIMASPLYDRKDAFEKQRELIQIKRDRLNAVSYTHLGAAPASEAKTEAQTEAKAEDAKAEDTKAETEAAKDEAASGEKHLIGVAMPTKDLQRWNQDGSNMKAELELSLIHICTWYGGVNVTSKSGIPLSLDKEEYEFVNREEAVHVIDTYSYGLGAMDCFCEMVSAGLKTLAMSHPCDTREERDSYLQDAEKLCRKYGVKLYPEDEAFITDLFPEELNKGKYNYLFYRTGDVLERYMGLKEQQKRLIADHSYTGQMCIRDRL